MKTMHLFAGAGGGLLADIILGHKPIVAVEWDDYACKILRKRVQDGWFPGLQVHQGDVRIFDPSQYKGIVDCIHAGFPCQDISAAGSKKGISGERSNLYREVVRISRAIRPNYMFFENSPDITFRGLDTVLCEIAEMGYNARWCCLGSNDTGGCHFRKRWWMLAYHREVGGRGVFRGANKERRIMGNNIAIKPQANWGMEEVCRQRDEWEDKRENSLPPFLCRVDDEMAENIHRLECIGNGQDPVTAAAAFTILFNSIHYRC